MTIPKQTNRRKELVTIAAGLFKQESFDRTTVRMLASATGIKSGSLFHHFKDKEEILVAVIEGGLETSIEVINKQTADIEQVDQRLFAAIYGHLMTLHGENKDAHIVSIIEWKSLSTLSKSHLIRLRDEYETIWQGIIEQALEAKLLEGEAHLLRLFVLGSLNWTIQWFKPEQGLDIEQLAAKFYQSLTHQVINK
mgnify:CR=1 FL=1|jgi:AcrR family transcriptional regulator|tara:strand:- start:10564 stop:11148 length:585 start_codon:yes stop_codon:yes gene_type:complete